MEALDIPLQRVAHGELTHIFNDCYSKCQSYSLLNKYLSILNGVWLHHNEKSTLKALFNFEQMWNRFLFLSLPL